MPQQLAFVLTDGSARIRSPERQLIRHHCMRRRNKQPGSRRSKREAARGTAGYLRKLEKDRESTSGPLLVVVNDGVAFRSNLSAEEGRKQASSPQGTLPPPPPSDWALFQFPEELDVFSQKLMHQCT